MAEKTPAAERVTTEKGTARTAYEEEKVEGLRVDVTPPDDERVVVKPDARGGYTVEKFGGSVHFTREQWANTLEAVKVADQDRIK